MNMRGHVKLYRRLSESKLWLSEPFSRGQAWVDLLFLAHTKEEEIEYRGIPISVRRGHVSLPPRKLAQRWKWSRTKVVDFINSLVNEGQIKAETIDYPYPKKKYAKKAAKKAAPQKTAENGPESEEKKPLKKPLGQAFLTTLFYIVNYDYYQGTYAEEKAAEKAAEKLPPENAQKLAENEDKKAAEKAAEKNPAQHSLDLTKMKDSPSKEKEIKKNPPKGGQKEKEKEKFPYGIEFQNVKLTRHEKEKLDDRLNGRADYYIDRLDAYLEQTGKRYKSHYAAILNWVDRDKRRGPSIFDPPPQNRRKRERLD